MSGQRQSRRIDFACIVKAIRAQVIRKYMERNKISHAVCFSCGNASAVLKGSGVQLLDISSRGDLQALRWFTMEEVRSLFPTCMDATSGHLSIDLLLQIADQLRQILVLDANKTYVVPTGSGETILCLKLAFPHIHFIAEYDNSDPATEYSANAPLTPIIASFFETRIAN